MACSLSETIYSEAFDFVPHGTETISYWSCMIHNIAPYEAYLKKKKKTSCTYNNGGENSGT